MRGLNRAQIALRQCTHDGGVLCSRTTVPTRAVAIASSSPARPRAALQSLSRPTILPRAHALSRCFSQTAVLDSKSKSKEKRANKRSAAREEERNTQEDEEEEIAAPSRGRAKEKAAQQADSAFDRDAAFDLGDVEAEYTRVDERFDRRLQECKVGGRFNPEMLGQLRVKPDRDSAQSWPLRELAQVVHRGGRSVSILVSDAEYVKPIMSAVQNSDDFNQQPQRDPDNELELTLRIELENPDEQLRRLRGEVTAWRDAIRGVMAARKLKHAAWRKENHVTKDDVKALEKKIKEMQDKKIEQIDRSQKQIVQQMEKRQTRL
ncbi:ribosome recycling factor domain-containing protein [Diaporthe sp. PMI_573]|nr:ribosome recycling factor domain-containing protein [Diaporthaceae sp. PMI_573]